MTKQYIQDNLLTKIGTLNSNKTKLISETAEELYLIYFDTVPHKCYCGGVTKFKTFTTGYREYCSTKCLNNSPEVQTNKKNTLQVNYGVDYALQSKAISEKRRNTLILRYNDMYYNNRHKFILTNMTLYGKPNYNNRGKAKQTSMELFGVDNYFKSKEFIKVAIENGRRRELSEMDDFEIYKKAVWRVTNNQDITKLSHVERRGHVRNKDAYHLDHKFSILQGFRQNVPVYIIGDICNLEMIPASSNCSKGTKCSVSLDELLVKINTSKNRRIL